MNDLRPPMGECVRCGEVTPGVLTVRDKRSWFCAACAHLFETAYRPILTAANEGRPHRGLILPKGMTAR